MLPAVSIHFSPPQGTARAIASVIATAQKSILVQAYSFTSTPIAAGLIDAARRGVSVSLILDRTCATGKYSEFVFFRNAGLAPLVDSAHAIAHNKVMVIDSSLVITGSFNFTFNADNHNAENCLFIADPDIAAAYAANWQLHASHSSPSPPLSIPRPLPPAPPAPPPAPSFGSLVQHPPSGPIAAPPTGLVASGLS